MRFGRATLKAKYNNSNWILSKQQLTTLFACLDIRKGRGGTKRWQLVMGYADKHVHKLMRSTVCAKGQTVKCYEFRWYFEQKCNYHSPKLAGFKPPLDQPNQMQFSAQFIIAFGLLHIAYTHWLHSTNHKVQKHVVI